jgi:hypothetical protein
MLHTPSSTYGCGILTKDEELLFTEPWNFSMTTSDKEDECIIPIRYPG